MCASCVSVTAWLASWFFQNSMMWAVTFIPMPMPKTVCVTALYNKYYSWKFVQLFRAGVWV